MHGIAIIIYYTRVYEKGRRVLIELIYCVYQLLVRFMWQVPESLYKHAANGYSRLNMMYRYKYIWEGKHTVYSFYANNQSRERHDSIQVSESLSVNNNYFLVAHMLEHICGRSPDLAIVHTTPDNDRTDHFTPKPCACMHACKVVLFTFGGDTTVLCI